MRRKRAVSSLTIFLMMLMTIVIFLLASVDAFTFVQKQQQHSLPRQQEQKYCRVVGCFMSNDNDDQDDKSASTTSTQEQDNDEEDSSSRRQQTKSFFHKVPNKDDPPPIKPTFPLGFAGKTKPKSSKKKKEPVVRRVPTRGFNQKSNTNNNKKASYVAIGPPDPRINDPTRPERDAQGYTLYQDEETGVKSRVFEALVEYPCTFTLKVVGANQNDFTSDMVRLVADTCGVDKVNYTTREKGKWVSITIKAPVRSAEMLYRVYEVLGKDKRVKYKL